MRRLFFLFLVSTLVGCRAFQPSVMLRTPKNFEFSQNADSTILEYKISTNDNLQMRLFSNSGFQLINLAQSANNQMQLASGMSYIVEADGTVKLPTIGYTPIIGMTLREAELYLEEKYVEFYNNPFVMLTVSNRRVIVFPGSEGSARVITLSNENITLIEALALAGGITSTGKAHKIKVIRETGYGDTQVFQIDLSTIDGINQAQMVLQANDIIYVDPVFRVFSEVLAEITPIVSLLSSALIIYSAIFTISQTSP